MSTDVATVTVEKTSDVELDESMRESILDRIKQSPNGKLSFCEFENPQYAFETDIGEVFGVSPQLAIPARQYLRVLCFKGMCHMQSYEMIGRAELQRKRFRVVIAFIGDES